MNHWDPRAQELLKQARANERVPAEARARVKASVMASVALSAAAGASVSFAAAPTALAKLPAAVKAAAAVLPTTAAAVGQSATIVYLAPVTVGLALGLSAIAPSAVPPPNRTLLTPSSVVSTVPRTSPRAMSGPVATPPQTKSEPTSMAVPTSTASVSASVKAPSSLAEEASALERARLVLRQGDAELCLRLLDRHRADFPNGVLFFEALATRADALCRKGKTHEGLSILVRLEATAPNSGLLAPVRQTCAANREVPSDQ